MQKIVEVIRPYHTFKLKVGDKLKVWENEHGVPRVVVNDIGGHSVFIPVEQLEADGYIEKGVE